MIIAELISVGRPVDTFCQPLSFEPLTSTGSGAALGTWLMGMKKYWQLRFVELYVEELDPANVPIPSDFGCRILESGECLLQCELSGGSVPHPGVDHVEFHHIPPAPCS